jgi:glycosyltransferase involved in cell wall biosynthesis
MSKVLLLPSADRRRDLERLGRHEVPRRDYLELAGALEAETFDFGQVVASPAGRRLARWLGKGPAHAFLASRRLGDCEVVFSDSEHVGLFLGILLGRRRRRPRHVLLAHHLTPAKKRPFARLGRGGIDALILHSEAQRRFAIGRLGFDAAKIHVLPYQVDTAFWEPQEVVQEDLVCTAGLECRDYATLAAAVDGLPIAVRIGAASNWSRKSNLLRGQSLPANIEVSSYSYLELRALYARSRFVVVPLLDVDFQAGITLILEAMAMARAVVVTETQGQYGAIIGPRWQAGLRTWPAAGPPVEESSGIYVPAGDPAALRSAMSYLIEQPGVASTLGRNGRLAAERDYSLEQFVRRFAAVIDPVAAPADR